MAVRSNGEPTLDSQPQHDLSDSDDLLAAYRKTDHVDRSSAAGRILRWMGAHPFLAGAIGGAATVVAAGVSSWEGVAAQPGAAAIMAAVVWVTWIVLFGFLRNFFVRLSTREVDRTYEVRWDGDQLRWLEGDEVVRAIEEPEFELFVADEPDAGREDDLPWPVYLVVDSPATTDHTEESDEMVFKTRVTTAEARGYPVAGGEIEERVDDQLPIHLASSLLQLADRGG